MNITSHKLSKIHKKRLSWGSENEYEAGHVIRYHANHSGSDNKYPDTNA